MAPPSHDGDRHGGAAFRVAYWKNRGGPPFLQTSNSSASNYWYLRHCGRSHEARQLFRSTYMNTPLRENNYRPSPLLQEAANSVEEERRKVCEFQGRDTSRQPSIKERRVSAALLRSFSFLPIGKVRSPLFIFLRSPYFFLLSYFRFKIYDQNGGKFNSLNRENLIFVINKNIYFSISNKIVKLHETLKNRTKLFPMKLFKQKFTAIRVCISRLWKNETSCCGSQQFVRT